MKSHEYCGRCDAVVPVDRPHPGWRTAKKVWFVIAAGCAVVTPVIAADAFFLTPLVVAFLMGGGYIDEQSERAATCRVCGGPIANEKKASTSAQSDNALASPKP
ncbi:MAG: hypothetical protein AAF411_05830 [Myxococcota bacterium]